MAEHEISEDVLDMSNDDNWQKFLDEQASEDEQTGAVEAEGEEQQPEGEAEKPAEPAAEDGAAEAVQEEAKEEPKEEPKRSFVGTPEHEAALTHKLQDERRKRQALEKELEQMRAPKEEPRALPDPIDDPEGFHEHQQKQRMEDQQRHFVSEIRNGYAQDKLEALQFVEGYKEDYELIRSTRAAQLRDQVPDISDDQIEQQIQADEIQLAAQAAQMGVKPHQLIQKMVRDHHEQARAWAEANGYVKPEAKAIEQAADVTPLIPKDEARRRNVSLTQASGGGKTGLAPLDSLSRKEQETLSREEWEKRMGLRTG